MAEAVSKKGRPRSFRNANEAKKVDFRYSEPSEELFIALQRPELNWEWYKSEVQELKQMWQDGKDIRDIASYFDRLQVEVALLIMDLRIMGDIDCRDSGIFGFEG